MGAEGGHLYPDTNQQRSDVGCGRSRTIAARRETILAARAYNSGMEAFLGATLIVAFIAYCHFTSKDQREFHLFLVWCFMGLSIIATPVYYVGRALLR